MSAQKKLDENARNQADIDNLQLQSLLYEKNHFENQIHYCRQYETNNLEKVLNDVGPEDSEMVEKITSMTVNTMKIENGKKSQDFQQIRLFLNK